MANYFRFFMFALALASIFCEVNGAARRTFSNRVSPGKTGNRARDTTVDNSYFPYLIADDYVMVENDAQECFSVLANDRTHQLNAASLTIYAQPEHGSATVSGSTICYQPWSNFHGWETFSYSVCTMDNLCDWAEIRVYVVHVNQAPVAVNDRAVVNEEDMWVTIDVLANDYDVDGPFTNYASLQIVSNPQFGTATITADHKIIYIPDFEGDNRQIGLDTFVYQICDTDATQLCSYGTVGVSVEDVCFTCEECQSTLTSFNDHASTIRGIYQNDVYSSVLSP